MFSEERTKGPDPKAGSFEFAEKIVLPESGRTPPTFSIITSCRQPKAVYAETLQKQIQRRAYFTSVTGPKDLGSKHFSQKFKHTRIKHLETYTSGFRVEKEKSLFPAIDKDRDISSHDEPSTIVRQRELGVTSCTMKLEKKGSGETVQTKNDHFKEIVTAYRKPQKRSALQQSAGSKRTKQTNIQTLENNLRIQINNFSNANEVVEYFNRKCGFKQAPIFVFNSQDQYIRRILLYWGWNQNRVLDSPFFNLKWSYKDSISDYSRLVPGQLFNHFKNNQQLTSKGRLLVNIRNNSYSTGISHDFYFPRCYDLGNPNDVEEFNLEYENTTVFIILRKTYEFLKQKVPKGEFEQIERQIKDRSDRKQKGYYVRKDKHHARPDGRFQIMRFQNYRNRREDFLLHINLCILVLKYLRNLKRSSKIDRKDKQNHILHFQNSEFKNNFQQILKYSTMTPPYKPSKDSQFCKQFFSTPSKFTIEKFIGYYNYFNNIYGKVWQAQGYENIWVIKPANNSRGNGIYLHKDRAEITGSSEGVGSRIAQKYIEKPLIIKNPAYAQIVNKKFDIRQWVLVVSYLPLKIYRFSECYLRICSESYDLSQIKALQKHLTNYSFNKNNFMNKSQSVISLDIFRQILRKQYKSEWQTNLVPKINEIIIDVIQRCSQNIEENIQSFELYGFDILIDSQLNPWLLQVNLSPACEQRCDFLKDYCEIMGEKLLRLVLPPELQPNGFVPLNKNFEKYEWIHILKQDAYFEQKKGEVDLQIVGKAANIKKEKYIDKKYKQNEAALQIQTLYKMIKAMRILKIMKTEVHIKTIRKFLVSFNNTIKTRKIQYSEKSRIIFSYLAPKIDQIRLKPLYQSYQIQHRIEKYFKGKVQQSKYSKLRIQQSVRLIKLMYLHQKQMQLIIEKKYFLSKVKSIQRFYKKRFLMLNKAAKLIQKHMKIYCFKCQRARFHRELIKRYNQNVLSNYLKGLAESVKFKRKLKMHYSGTLFTSIKSFSANIVYQRNKIQLFLNRIGFQLGIVKKRNKSIGINIIKQYSDAKSQAISKISQHFKPIVISNRYKTKLAKWNTKKISKYFRGLLIQDRYPLLLQEHHNRQELQRVDKIVSTQAFSDIDYLIRERIQTSRKISVEQTSNQELKRSVNLPIINTNFNKYMNFIAKSNAYLEKRKLSNKDNKYRVQKKRQ